MAPDAIFYLSIEPRNNGRGAFGSEQANSENRRTLDSFIRSLNLAARLARRDGQSLRHFEFGNRSVVIGGVQEATPSPQSFANRMVIPDEALVAELTQFFCRCVDIQSGEGDSEAAGLGHGSFGDLCLTRIPSGLIDLHSKLR